MSCKRYYPTRMNYIKGEIPASVATLFEKKWLPDAFHVYKLPDGIGWQNAKGEPRDDLPYAGTFTEYSRYDETVRQVESA